MNRLASSKMSTRRAAAIVRPALPVGALLLLVLGMLFAVTLLVAPPVALSAELYTVGGQEVSIYNLAGELLIEPYDGPDVVVEVTRAGAGGGSLKVETGSSGTRRTLRVIFPSNHIVYPKLGRGSSTNLRVRADGTFGDAVKDFFGRRVTISGSGSGLEAHADLRVRVPAGKKLAVYVGAGATRAGQVKADLDLHNSSGAVECNDVTGALSVDTGSGSVQVHGVQGDLNVDTGSGHVVADGIGAHRLHIDTGSGSVAVNRSKTAILDVDTGSGDVLAEDLDAGDIHVDTGSGRVSLELTSSPGRVYVDTGSGAVLVRVPTTYSAQFDLDAGSGDIEIELPHTTTRHDDGTLRGQIGSGGGSLKVDTGSGGIRVLRATRGGI